MNIRSLSFLLVSLSSLILAGCAGGPPESRGGGPGPRRARMHVEAVNLSGTQAFFDGRIQATVTVTNQMMRPPGKESEAGRPEGRGSGGGPGGGMRGGMNIGMGGGGGGGGMGGGGPGGGGMGGGMPPPGSGGEGGEFGQRSMLRESGMPPMSLRLELANLSDQPLKVLIWELNSELGNFAVRPDVVTISPGARVSPDAMTSRLGLSSKQLPVSLVLRLGAKEEKQVLLLQPVPVSGPKP